MSNGKGDRYRDVDKKEYDKTWIRIFGEDCPTCHGMCKDNIICVTCDGLGKVERDNKKV